MAYRDDLAALEARKLATEAELVEKTRARDELARLVDEARYLAQAEHAFAGDRPDPKRRARRHRLRLLAAAAAAVVAGGGVVTYQLSRPARPDPAELLARMATFERAMCECTELGSPSSSECARRVSDDMTRWGAEQTKQTPFPPKLDERQMKRAAEIGERMGTCMQRAMMPEPPIAAPEPAPRQASEACDEVACVLDNYEPTCCSVFKHAPTKRATSSELPDGLDRSMISAGIASVKGRVMTCGDRSNAKGKVKVRVTVGGHGRVTQMSVEVAPDPALGACVAAAVQMASFAKTQEGGSFSYPFVF